MTCGQDVQNLHQAVSQTIDALTMLDCGTLEDIALRCGCWSSEANSQGSSEASEGLGSDEGKLQVLAKVLDLSKSNLLLLRRLHRSNAVLPEYVSGSGGFGSGALD